MDAVQHLAQAVARAPLDGGLAERNPLGQHLPERLLHGYAVQADHGQVDRRRCFQAGVRQQRGDQLGLFDAAGLGLEYQPYRRVFIGLIAHHIQHREHAGFELALVLAQGFFAGLDFGVGDLLNLFEHPLRAHARRELGHYQLPLAARQVFYLPTRAHFERAAAGAVRVGNVGGCADDLPATRKVRPWHQRQQLLIRGLGVFDQRHASVGNFTQVVAGNLGGQSHSDTAGPVKQRERQARGQLARLLGRAVVVGHKVHRALVDLIEQQAGDFGQTRLGVAHSRSAVAVARAEVTLAVNQRVALRKILRHAHQRVIRRLVAMRMKTTQHITHHARTFDRLGAGIVIATAKAQAHTRHGIQNPPLHRLLPVAHIRQGAPFDCRQRIFQISALRISGQVELVVAFGRGLQVERSLIGHRNSCNGFTVVMYSSWQAVYK